MHLLSKNTLLTLSIGVSLVVLSAQTPDETFRLEAIQDTLSEADKRSAKNAVNGLSLTKGLAMTLFASEPMITNPTNMEIDHKGRIWLTEAYNYRNHITGKPAKKAGDRVVILEDTNHDGIADSEKIFYQGEELNAPIGICVLGNKVIVSQSPNVWLLTDHDNDDKADSIEKIFTGISGADHDHGIHSFSFAPDGKLYFAMGNEAKQLRDKDGNPVKDKNGKEIDFKNYREGLLLRCDLDFTNIEVLGHNFRNNYEPAVDSYGTIWQSDNDDDGNRAVRINYVMENGNYGFSDEMTGASWPAIRTNIEDSIPDRHWHLNDPGVVPNLLHTGAGSPTGLTIYEGNLLPAAFRNQLIHSDAGPNVVRAYPTEKNGAGYKATMLPILEGKHDKWFRPTDVAVAPDGSLFITDWYDPAVGGHNMGDADRGRVYRVAPQKGNYRFSAMNLKTTTGILAALNSPNNATRYLAWQKIQEGGRTLVPSLLRIMNSSSTPSRFRARALWALSKMDQVTVKEWAHMLQSPDADLRVTAIRALRQSETDRMPYLTKMLQDNDPQVRREIALSLYDIPTQEAADAWAQLALQHNPTDRWELEALGIGAHNNWDKAFKTWFLAGGENVTQTAAGKNIVWRSRTDLAIPYLATYIKQNAGDFKNSLRYFRAFDFIEGDGKLKTEALLSILENPSSSKEELTEIVFRHLDPQTVPTHPKASAMLQKALDDSYGTNKYVELLKRYPLKHEQKRLLDLAIVQSTTNLGRSAGQLLLNQGGLELIKNTIYGADLKQAAAILAAVRSAGTADILKIQEDVLANNRFTPELRIAAAKSMTGSWGGEDLLLSFLRKGFLTDQIKVEAIKSLSHAWRKTVQAEAKSYLTNSIVQTSTKHPDSKELIRRTGDVKKGKDVFATYCAVCHQVGKEGFDFGPKLTEIGGKLPKEGLYMALFSPNSGISFGFETSEIQLKDGSSIMGIISSKTEKSVVVKFPGGGSQEFPQTTIKSIKKLEQSMMPTGLEEAMTTVELIDLIEYMHALK